MRWCFVIKKTLITFILVQISFQSWANPAPQIISIEESFIDHPIHHGLYLEILMAPNPKLSSYEVQIKKDRRDIGMNWEKYSSTLLPYLNQYLFIPYRNGKLSLEAGVRYCLRLRAVYGSEVSPWVRQCNLLFNINERIESDEDRDGLLDHEEYILGTDPRNRDSDGDHFLDGEEIEMEIDPNRPQIAEINLRSPTINFGPGDPLGQKRSQHQHLTIENIGEVPLRVSGLSLINHNEIPGIDAFHIDPNLSNGFNLSQIPPDNIIHIPLSFIPTFRGEAAAQIRIQSNLALNNTVTLHGEGVGFPDCSFEPEEIDFGTVIQNNQELSIENLTIKNRAPTQFRPDRDFNQSSVWELSISSTENEFVPLQQSLKLNANQIARVPILFRHESRGEHRGHIEIRSFLCGTLRIPVQGKVE